MLTHIVDKSSKDLTKSSKDLTFFDKVISHYPIL